MRFLFAKTRRWIQIPSNATPKTSVMNLSLCLNAPNATHTITRYDKGMRGARTCRSGEMREMRGTQRAYHVHAVEWPVCSVGRTHSFSVLFRSHLSI